MKKSSFSFIFVAICIFTSFLASANERKDFLVKDISGVIIKDEASLKTLEDDYNNHSSEKDTDDEKAFWKVFKEQLDCFHICSAEKKDFKVAVEAAADEKIPALEQEWVDLLEQHHTKSFEFLLKITKALGKITNKPSLKNNWERGFLFVKKII
jgi:hypothetical protein